MPLKETLTRSNSIMKFGCAWFLLITIYMDSGFGGNNGLVYLVNRFFLD